MGGWGRKRDKNRSEVCMSIKVDTVVYETGKDPPAYRVSYCGSQYILAETSHYDKYKGWIQSSGNTVVT